MADPKLVDAMWRATDLTGAYLTQNRTWIAACLTNLDTDRLELLLTWLGLDHDKLFDELGEPSMTVREIDALAALAPLEIELAITTAAHRVAAKETGLARAVEELPQPTQIHTIAICTAVMLLEGLGHTNALERLDEYSVQYEQRGHPRPYTIT